MNKRVQRSQILQLWAVTEGAAHISYRADRLRHTAWFSCAVSQAADGWKPHVIAPNDTRAAEEHFAEVSGIGNNTARKLQEKLSASWAERGRAAGQERGQDKNWVVFEVEFDQEAELGKKKKSEQTVQNIKYLILKSKWNISLWSIERFMLKYFYNVLISFKLGELWNLGNIYF